MTASYLIESIEQKTHEPQKQYNWQGWSRRLVRDSEQAEAVVQLFREVVVSATRT